MKCYFEINCLISCNLKGTLRISFTHAFIQKFQKFLMKIICFCTFWVFSQIIPILDIEWSLGYGILLAFV
jgi:hypothetical protein